jgi:hypothetical protein
MAFLEWNLLIVVVVVVDISVVAHDEVSLLFFKIHPRHWGIIEEFVGSQSSQEKDGEEVENGGGGRPVLPSGENEILLVAPSVNSNSFHSCSSYGIAFLISLVISDHPSLVVIALDGEVNLRRGLDSCLDVDEILLNRC